MDKPQKKIESSFSTTAYINSAEWRAIWQRLTHESQQILESFHTHVNENPDWNVGMPIFNSDIVTDAFQKATERLMENPSSVLEAQQQLWLNYQQLWQGTLAKMNGAEAEPVIEEDPNDRRFKDTVWKEDPFFDFIRQSYLLNTRFLKKSVENIRGLDSKTAHKVNFYTRQFVDALAPTNFPLTNPQVLQETMATRGSNLLQGLQNFLEDLKEGNGQLRIKMTDEEAFQLGENLAATKGKVVFQNDLFQLIQYEPTTATVAKRPVLIVPPWINKYYIFDLRPENSFVRWALDTGLTIFVISWINPGIEQSKKTFSDYVITGVKTALDQVCALTDEKEVNTVGYCTGGILLSSLLGYMAGEQDHRIISATIMATPIDFSIAGDLMVYVCDQQLKHLSKHMTRKGYLAGQAMVNSFSLLRSNDLIWSFFINNYMLGRKPFPFDMLYWNCDATRMPATMHGYYLRKMYLENRLLKPGGIRINHKPINLAKVKTPTFVMAGVDDHIAPWRAAYPLTQLFKGKKKFVLGGSGHVAGCFNHPKYNKYHYWTHDSLPQSANDWFEKAVQKQGSWWIEWRKWLEEFTGSSVAARSINPQRALEDAPGSYALVRGD
jgi:polyhydroxyalkanoate synthase